MTPSQLEHLKLIDAHLERLLAIAEKRTPEEWRSGGGLNLQMQSTGKIYIHPGIAAMFQSNLFAEEDATFIASCAGNAEAGWRATRAAIAEILSSHEARYESWCLVCKELGQEPILLKDYPLPPWAEDLLAAFPLKLIQKP